MPPLYFSILFCNGPKRCFLTGGLRVHLVPGDNKLTDALPSLQVFRSNLLPDATSFSAFKPFLLPPPSGFIHAVYLSVSLYNARAWIAASS